MKKLIPLALVFGLMLSGCSAEEKVSKKDADPGSPPPHPERLIEEPVGNLKQYAKMDNVRFPQTTTLGNADIVSAKYYGETLNKEHPVFGPLVKEELKTTVYSYTYEGKEDSSLTIYAVPLRLDERVKEFKELEVKSDMKVYVDPKQKGNSLIAIDETVTYVMVGKNLPKGLDGLKSTVTSMKGVK